MFPANHLPDEAEGDGISEVDGRRNGGPMNAEIKILATVNDINQTSNFESMSLIQRIVERSHFSLALSLTLTMTKQGK